MSTHRSLGSASLAGPALACLLLANATPPASAQPAPQKQVAPAASSSATPHPQRAGSLPGAVATRDA